jgi:peptide/nickel transport system substrate-binding protein
VHGEPHLKRFIVRTYQDKDQLYAAFADKQITASSGFGVYEAEQYEKTGHAVLYEWPTANQAFTFFNTQQPILSDAGVRRALTQATRPQAAAAQFDYRFTTADAPLLPEHIGYNEQLTQLKFNQEEAKRELEAAGWVVGEGGIRYKDGQPLKLQLVTQNSDVYPALAASLQEQWRAVGVDLQVRLLNNTDLSLQYIQSRKYDVLLYGISLGADPDVYSFWHSSAEKDPGLNFSRYQSSDADVALESARARLDPKLRAAKYETFLRAWRNDAPAIAMYRPDFLYAAQTRVKGLDVVRLISPSDRFYNVQNWTINTEPVLKRVAE